MSICITVSSKHSTCCKKGYLYMKVWLLLHVPDTDDIKQKNKNMKQYLITPKALTENNNFFWFTSSVSGTILYTK